jgi:hypothetical protein
MADEVLGNAYEIITEIAVRDYSSISLPGESVFAQGKPMGAGIIPDLTIGKTENKPRILLQVHHTLAESASQKKFWRNIGEYVDARLALGAQIRIMTISFDSGQKRRLSMAAQNLMDGFLEIDRASYGSVLLKFGGALATTFIKNKTPEANRLSESKKALAGDKVTIGAITQLASEIEHQLKSASQAGANWFQTYQQVQSTRGTPRIPTRKLTTLRRALGRFLPIDDESHLRRLLTSVRNQTKADWPEFLLQVNVAQKVIGGARFSQPSVSGKKLESHPAHEVWCMTQLLSDDDIVDLWDGIRNATASLQQACASIRASNEFGVFHAFVVKHFNTLTTPNGLKNALLDCFKDPGFVLGEKLAIKNPAGRGVWLFEYLMTVIKTETGKQQGYGYTKLARDANVLIPGKRSILDFALPKLINRSEFLPKGVDLKTSAAIATKLKAIGNLWIAKNQATISNFSLKGAFEDKVYKTASFDPLLHLINNALAGTTITRTKRHETFLSKFMTKGAATCDVLQAGDCAIFKQASFEGHPSDKSKELMGRVGMLWVQQTGSGQSKQAPYKKIFLVIDGSWKQDQINRLAKAGFDGIYYPDELDQLAKAITP